MSLQKKIEQDMNDLACRIIRRCAGSTTDPKLAKMSAAWFKLRELLEMANSVAKIDKNVSMEDKGYDTKVE